MEGYEYWEQYASRSWGVIPVPIDSACIHLDCFLNIICKVWLLAVRGRKVACKRIPILIDDDIECDDWLQVMLFDWPWWAKQEGWVWWVGTFRIPIIKSVTSKKTSQYWCDSFRNNAHQHAWNLNFLTDSPLQPSFNGFCQFNGSFWKFWISFLLFSFLFDPVLKSSQKSVEADTRHQMMMWDKKWDQCKCSCKCSAYIDLKILVLLLLVPERTVSISSLIHLSVIGNNFKPEPWPHTFTL